MRDHDPTRPAASKQRTAFGNVLSDTPNSTAIAGPPAPPDEDKAAGDSDGWADARNQAAP